MFQSFICLSKYIQGEGELKRIGEHISHLGQSFFIVTSKGRMTELKSVVEKSFQGTDAKLVFATFGGECSKGEVAKLREQVKASKCEAIVGLGGGKVMDTARAVAYYEKLPVVIVPTVASCDAPTSALVIFYTDDGVFEEKLVTKHNPDVVLVDTNIIAKSPVRLLVAGMGDALATYFEARTCVETCRTNYGGGGATLTSYAIAKLCYETLLADGVAAKCAVENKVVTKALNNIIEANTLMSGIGFECNGSAAAHSLYSGFSTVANFHEKFHGEWVAFGTLVLLVLENRPKSEVDEVVRFCMSVGLPTTLQDLGLENISREDLYKVAKKASAPPEAIHKEPFIVTADDVMAAIIVADAIGRRYK